MIAFVPLLVYFIITQQTVVIHKIVGNGIKLKQYVKKRVKNGDLLLFYKLFLLQACLALDLDMHASELALG